MVSLSADVLDQDNLRAIRTFADKMEQRGVTVLFSHAPLNALCVTSSTEENAGYAQAVREQLELPVLVDYPDAVMDADLFYDSNNHLNTEGTALYTQKLIDGLAALDKTA